MRDQKVARCVSLHLILNVARTEKAIRYEMVAEVCISAISQRSTRSFLCEPPSDAMLVLRSPFFVNLSIQILVLIFLLHLCSEVYWLLRNGHASCEPAELYPPASLLLSSLHTLSARISGNLIKESCRRNHRNPSSTSDRIRIDYLVCESCLPVVWRVKSSMGRSLSLMEVKSTEAGNH